MNFIYLVISILLTMSSFDTILSLSTLVDTDEFKKATEKFWNDASINNLYKVKDVELVLSSRF